MIKPENQNDLSAWLSWMEACHPAEIELGLDRVRTVAEHLALDFSASTVVTVAGTNGKGSTISYLNTLYSSAGYSVGCYTSPHFLHYNERVRLNGQNVSDQQLCDAFNKIDQARGEIPLTYFEFGTLAALVIFSETAPELILLEVGLGGRLDAVNIVDADIAVVTTVALDHMDWLGDNREDIGFEKAGIFRGNKPAICGDLQPPASVAAVAQNLGADLYQSGVQFSYTEHESDWSWCGASAHSGEIKLTGLPLPSLPLQNAATVLQVVQFIPLPVTEVQIKAAIADASLTGRMQKLNFAGIDFYLDVAHNPEAAGHLAQRIKQLPGRSWLVLGMLADKDCQSVLQQLAPCVEQLLLVSLDVPRGQSATQLGQCLDTSYPVILENSVASAIERIKKATNPPDNVIIAGSFFTVADALNELELDQA